MALKSLNKVQIPLGQLAILELSLNRKLAANLFFLFYLKLFTFHKSEQA